MRALVYIIFILFVLCGSSIAQDAIEYKSSSGITQLQQYRSRAKLYVPKFVLIGTDASFKVFAGANDKIKIVMDYGSYIDRQIYEQQANENGVAVFNVKILNDEDLVGKSVAIDAYVLDKRDNIVQKAVMQTDNATVSSSNRVYIADKDSAKGFVFTPWQSLNTVIMSTDYEERSNYNPLNNQYYDKTPIYVKNMRDAQDNVRQLPANNSNSN